MQADAHAAPSLFCEGGLIIIHDKVSVTLKKVVNMLLMIDNLDQVNNKMSLYLKDKIKNL